jgi:hypothetical protein
VCKNHHGGAPVLDEPPAKQKAAEKPAENSKPAAKKLEFDFSSIDPEKEWECFGTIDKNHSECQECPFAKRCEEKKVSKSK